MSKSQKTILLVFLIIFVDQFSKLWVKTHLQLGEGIHVFDWFYILFVENNGMAFGIEFIGKIFLSLFRIIAVCLLVYYIYKLLKGNKTTYGYIASVAAVLAGAIGNIIDCVFYGIMFTDSYGRVAKMFPPEGGYETLFRGKVVDMLYFPIIESSFPSWIPFVGGQDFVFFSPVFNLADSAICIGIFVIILFYRNTLKTELDALDDIQIRKVNEA